MKNINLIVIFIFSVNSLIFSQEIIIKNKNNGLYFLTDSLGKAIISDYDIIISPHKNWALVKEHYNKKWGCIDKRTQNFIIPAKYDSIVFDYPYVKVMESGLWGYFHLKAKKISPRIYQEINASDDLLIAKYENRWGVINNKGKILIPFNYLNISSNPNRKEYFIVKNSNELVGVYNSKGKRIIPEKYLSAWINYPKEKKKMYFTVSTDPEEWSLYGRSYGAFDKKGKVIVPPRFIHTSINLEQKKGKCHWVKKKGKEKIPFYYDFFMSTTNGWIVRDNHYYWGAIDHQGKIIIPLEYEEIKKVKNNLLLAKKNNFWGIINLENKIVVPYQYQDIKDYENNDFLYAQKDGKWGEIDLNGNVTIPFQYDEIYSFYQNPEGSIVVKNNLYGVVNKDKEEVVPCIYDDINRIYNRTYNSNLIEVKKNKKFGLINKNTNKEIIPIVYDYLIYYEDNHIIFGRKESSWEMISDDGKLVSSSFGSFINKLDTDFTWVEKNDKYGFIDDKGDIVIPITYDKIIGFNNFDLLNNGNLIRAQRNGKYGVINTLGNEIIPFIYEDYDHIQIKNYNKTTGFELLPFVWEGGIYD